MQPFIVNLKGLSRGESRFEWEAGAEFFESFGNEDILDAQVKAEATVVNKGARIEVNCSLEGSVTVPCDRCLDDLVLEFSAGFEETYIPEGTELDLGQDVYDFVIISLPIVRVHPDGECNEDTIKYLSK